MKHSTGNKKNEHIPEKKRSVYNLFDTGAKDWGEVKAQVKTELEKIGEGRVADWLATFDQSFGDFSKSVVLDSSRKVLQGFRSGNSRPPYEPHLFESLLKGCGSLLDRCLANKRDLAEMEVAGIKVALDYLSYRKLRPISDELESCVLQDERAHKMRESMEEAARVFAGGAAASDHVALGLREQALGSAEDYQKLNVLEARRRVLLKYKSDISDDAQTAMFTRYLAPGGVQNFAERHIRIRKLFKEDLDEAFRKIYSVCVGIRQCFKVVKLDGYPLDVPLFESHADIGGWCQQQASWIDLVAPDILDALVLWTRRAMRELERIIQYETEDTIVLPLNQYWLLGLDAATPNQPLTTDFIRHSMNKDGILEFYLNSGLMPFYDSYRTVRVLGVGISVSGYEHILTPFAYHQDLAGEWPIEPKTEVDFNARKVNVEKAAKLSAMEINKKFNAMIWFPNLMIGELFTYERLPMACSSVGYEQGDNEVNIKCDPMCRNVNPFEGMWKIQIDSRALLYFGWDHGDAHSPPSELSLTRNSINGLFLHLRLRMLPKGISL
jgi:hypothetical protein